MTPRLTGLRRYPVKGCDGHFLDHVSLRAGDGVPGDRAWAIARGDTTFDPAAPRWLPKERFVMLMRDADLARVRCRAEGDATLAFVADGHAACRADPHTPDGRAALDDWLHGVLGLRPGGRVRLVAAGAQSFTDVPQNCVSLLNLASVRDLGARIGATVAPERFRANLLVDDVPPWRELDWVGGTVRIGPVRVRVIKRIKRCAAIQVDPATGARDLQLLRALRQERGHVDMGVYAEVLDGGPVAVGDPVVPPARTAGAGARAGTWARFWTNAVRLALTRPRSSRAGGPTAR